MLGKNLEISPYAKLFVPTSKQPEAVAWRFELIRKTNVFDVGRLSKLLEVRGAEGHKESFVKEVSEIADLMALDEVDMALIFATAILSDVEKMRAEDVILYHPQADLYMKTEGITAEETAKIFRPLLIDLKNDLFKIYLPEVRAKVAVLELLCSLPRRPTLLVLLSLSCAYVTSEASYGWIRYYQYRAKFGSEPEKSEARGSLKAFQKAILGDGRALQKNRFKQWRAYFQYAELCDLLHSFRTCHGPQASEEKNRSSEVAYRFDLNSFKSHFKTLGISRDYIDRVLRGGHGHSIGEIALDIMVEFGTVASPKAFRAFQAQKNLLAEKYKWLKDAIILLPFLNAQEQYPELVNKCPIEDVLCWCKL